MSENPPDLEITEEQAPGRWSRSELFASIDSDEIFLSIGNQHDGEGLHLTPDQADRLADWLKAAAVTARGAA